MSSFYQSYLCVYHVIGKSMYQQVTRSSYKLNDLSNKKKKYVRNIFRMDISNLYILCLLCDIPVFGGYVLPNNEISIPMKYHERITPYY